MNKRFKVFVTQSSSSDGNSSCTRANEVDMRAELESHNIGCTVVADSAVGYILESVDCVMTGAEGVVESGGIINKVSLCLYLVKYLRVRDRMTCNHRWAWPSAPGRGCISLQIPDPTLAFG